jgi:hypothetical protein
VDVAAADCRVRDGADLLEGDLVAGLTSDAAMPV